MIWRGTKWLLVVMYNTRKKRKQFVVKPLCQFLSLSHWHELLPRKYCQKTVARSNCVSFVWSEIEGCKISFFSEKLLQTAKKKLNNKKANWPNLKKQNLRKKHASSFLVHFMPPFYLKQPSVTEKHFQIAWQKSLIIIFADWPRQLLFGFVSPIRSRDFSLFFSKQ